MGVRQGQPAPGFPGFGGRRGRRGMPVTKAKDVRGTVRRLWEYFGEQRQWLAILALSVIAGTAIGLAVPYLIGQAIDAIDAAQSVELGLLRTTVLVLLVAYIIEALIRLGQGWLMAGVSQSVVAKLRRSLFAKLQNLPIAFFDRHTHGELMSRLSNDIEAVNTTIAQSTIQLITSSFMIVGSLIMMLILSPLLTLAGMITIPLVFAVAHIVTRHTRILFREQQQSLGRLNGHIEEMISGIDVVKAFNQEDRVVRQFDAINDALCQVGVKAQIWSGFIMPLMNVINNIGFTAIAAVGGALAVRDLITVGIIASFISYSRQFVRPLNEIASIFNVLQSAIAGAERVFEILDQEEEPEDSPDAIELVNPRGHIGGISFEALPGSSTAIVGPTGAGKTTAINLLTRFYDVSQGRILLDGRDIRLYTRDSLRRCFGIVLQDTYLFSGTIEENIRYGRLNATAAEIRRAAELANVDHFIQHLPEGYQTRLSESGHNLSQGQRQLLAIARAILADPAILILDEATSSVDTRTELRIQEAMLELMKGRTTFIIAHRLSTIRNADAIMVVHDGQIVEIGDHETLMRRRGTYHDLYFGQFRNIS